MNNFSVKAVAGIILSLSLSLPAAEIHQAVEKKDMTAVKKLVKADKSVINLESAGGTTPLHIAAGINSADIVELLIKNGANIEAVTKEGFTPLHWAASMNHSQAVRILLDNGADVTRKTKTGKTALQLAQQQKANDAAALLMPSEKKDVPSEAQPVPAAAKQAAGNSVQPVAQTAKKPEDVKSAVSAPDATPEGSIVGAVIDPVKRAVGLGEKREVDISKDIPEAEAAIKSGDYDTAYNLMSAALREYPDNPKVNMIYGTASYYQMDYARAILAYEAVLKKEPGNDAARYGIAQAYFMTRQFELARRSFSQVLTRNPPANIKSNIKGYMTDIEKGIKRFMYSGRIEVGVLYDSNVNVGPNSDTIDIAPIIFGAQVLDTLVLTKESQPQDSFGIAEMAQFSGLYDVSDIGGWMAIGDAMLFNNTYTDVDNLDTLYYQFSAGMRSSWQQSSIALPLRYSHIDLGGDPLVNMMGFAPTFTITRSISGRKNFLTGVVIEQRDYDSLDERDSQYLELYENIMSFLGERNNTFTVGMSVFSESADEDIYSNTGGRASAGYGYNLKGGNIIYGGIDYRMVNYDEQMSLAPEKRKDKQLQYVLKYDAVISGAWRMRVDARFTDNNSTFGLYEYTKEVYSISTYYVF